ncbi:uncharacterized protein LOC143466278 [Clavelina lepadiformis]|uniref:uncharacterized protein LOC143466278 n=1 Tax=Clavelina lepadiformis TaxID=159417 RepID=UPI0040434FA2
MTPTDVSPSLPVVNYTGEAKTETLILCSGLPSLHGNQTSKHNWANEAIIAPRVPAVNSRLAMLRNIDRRTERARKNGAFQKPPSSVDINAAGNRNLPFGSNRTQLVKVSVYTKAVNPYVVVYDSNKKYAKPAAYLKLVNCEISINQVAASKDNGQNGSIEDDDCTFRIIPHKNDDMDGTSVVTLRTSTPEKRDEWVEFLNSVKNGTEPLSGYVPGSSVLPTLVEQDDNGSEEENTNTDSLKAPTRRKAREGRRSSLNSLGIRLRCYNVGKTR